MLKVFNNPAFINTESVYVGEVEADICILHDSQQQLLKQFIEDSVTSTYFQDLENGQFFFFSSKKSDGIFIKISAKTAICIMANCKDTELQEHLFGETHKIRSKAEVCVVSCSMTFRAPKVFESK